MWCVLFFWCLGCVNPVLKEDNMSLSREVLWHPNGTLVLYNEELFIVDRGELVGFASDDAFNSWRLNKEEAVAISDNEAACLLIADRAPLAEVRIFATQDAFGEVYLHVKRQIARVPSVSEKSILHSWNVSPENIVPDTMRSRWRVSEVQTAQYRDGTLVSIAETDVLFLISDGEALALSSESVVDLLGFTNREPLYVTQGEFFSLFPEAGNCAFGISCITTVDLKTCPYDS